MRRRWNHPHDSMHMTADQNSTAVRSADCPAGDRRFVQETRSARAGPQPGDVRGARRQCADDAAVRAGAAGTGRSAGRFHPGDLALAVVHGAVRQLRRSDGRRARQGQAETLRKARRDIHAKKLAETAATARSSTSSARASTLRKGDVVLVEAGDFIPGDGEVIEGVASVDESAITGESAPVIRESGGDRSA